MKTEFSKKQMILGAAGFAILAASLFVYTFRAVIFSAGGNDNNDAGESGRAQTQEVKFRHPLTGVALESPTELPTVFGVAVENMVEAWPISGIDKAFLVIEAPVEAGIPRLLAFYFDDNEGVDKIGPVRSARPYFIDWNDELDAMYAHVGGSPEALDKIVKVKNFDLNQFWYDDFFWRSNDRNAPHNVYTSTDLLIDASEFLRGRFEDDHLPDYGLWNFKDALVADESDGAPAEETEGAQQETSDVTISFSNSDIYDATWKYIKENNAYKRWQGDSVMKMQNNDFVFANNVAIMETNVEILDNIGRRRIVTIGEGAAIILQDGRAIDGTWKKPSREERLRFYSESEEEIIWNAGATWIEVVSSLDSVAKAET